MKHTTTKKNKALAEIGAIGGRSGVGKSKVRKVDYSKLARLSHAKRKKNKKSQKKTNTP